MILIIDSGSFKADWVFLTHTFSKHIKTEGLNPYFIDSKTVSEKLEAITEVKENKKDIKRIFFYGAGCSTNDNKAIIYRLFQKIYPAAMIQVDTDLTGAAKALFNREKGIACILGTGSNCCLYDGEKITEQTPSLGYILGDEGSGAYMGKKLLRKYLYNQLPKYLGSRLEQEYQLNREKILKSIYQDHFPNRYLASFSEFIHTYKQEKAISVIINQSIEDFFTSHVMKLSKNFKKVRFAGSIAWFFKEDITSIAEKYKLDLDKVIQSPAKDLKKFHEKDIV
jgi:N-acetylglucosamine kinase-like BadF-type ATPase